MAVYVRKLAAGMYRGQPGRAADLQTIRRLCSMLAALCEELMRKQIFFLNAICASGKLHEVPSAQALGSLCDLIQSGSTDETMDELQTKKGAASHGHSMNEGYTALLARNSVRGCRHICMLHSFKYSTSIHCIPVKILQTRPDKSEQPHGVRMQK